MNYVLSTLDTYMLSSSGPFELYLDKETKILQQINHKQDLSLA